MNMTQEPAVRSALFVPGSRPERFDKAFATGADRIIVDFEDAVEEHLKSAARDNLAGYLSANPGLSVVVRINAFEHSQHHHDLEFCRHFAGVSAILLPKSEAPEQVSLAAATGKRVWPLIESAKGLHNLTAIAAAEGVERLTFGAVDLGLELGLRPGSPGASRVLDQVRYQVLVNTALLQLAQPLDTVFTGIADLPGLGSFADNARDMGFGGMLCIHPSQVAVVNAAFQASAEELEWARKVLTAAEGAPGAFRLDGRMIDAPVIAAAQRMLMGHRS